MSKDGNIIFNKKFFLKILRIVISITLLVYVLYSSGLTTDEGWNRLLKVLGNSDIFFLVISFLFIPVMDLVSTIKWHALTNAMSLRIGYWKLLVFYVVGRFFNLILPSSIGGDLIRVHLLGKATKRYADSAAVVFVERLTGVITLVILAIVAILAALTDFMVDWLVYALAGAFAGLIVMGWIIIDERPAKLFQKITEKHTSLLNSVFEKFERLRFSIMSFKHMRMALFMSFFNSILFYIVAVFNGWISILVFDNDVTLISMLIAVPIIMFIMNIPISIGNIGIMEFAYIFTLTKFGIGAPEALSLALLMRIKTFIAAGLGGLAYAFVSESMSSPTEISDTIENKLNS